VDALAGGLGLGLIAAAVVAALALEVLDERVAAREPASRLARRYRLAGRTLRPLLVLLVVAALAATVVRLFVFRS
jgi:hypothetical protein